MRRHTTKTDAMIVLGGAMLGGLAMYLLDPEAGDRRRKRIAAAVPHSLGEKWDDLASHAKDLTRRVVGETTGWQNSAADSAHALADQAREITHDVSNGAHAHASHLRDLGSRIWDRARNAASRAQDWRHNLSHRAAHAAHEAGDWLDPNERHHGVGAGIFTTVTVSCCAAGVGLMYYLDPDRGSTRRSQLYNATSSCLRSTGHSMRSMGRDIGERVRHLFRGAKESIVRNSPIDSGQLVKEIREEVARVSPYANHIQLMADADGTVTVTGSLPKHEIDGLLTLVHSMPGVSHVINRLESESNSRAPRQEPMSSTAHG